MKSVEPKSPKNSRKVRGINEDSNKKDHQKNDRSIDSTKVKYIIPPGLNYTVNEFIAHCEVGGNQPIMVIGDTGVGKSMFLEIYKKFYEERCKKKEKNPMSCGPTVPILGTIIAI